MTSNEVRDEETRRSLLAAFGNVAADSKASGTERLVAAIAAAELRGYRVPADVCDVVMWLTHRK